MGFGDGFNGLDRLRCSEGDFGNRQSSFEERLGEKRGFFGLVNRDDGHDTDVGEGLEGVANHGGKFR